MDAAVTIRRARSSAGLTLRGLAALAGTSDATLSAYETGHKTPRVDTMQRILRAAGFEAEVHLARRPSGEDRVAKGAELVDVLLLAEQFPARHERTLRFPLFGTR
jgi:transcriptional regulator with XRE-family HTH domain